MDWRINQMVIGLARQKTANVSAPKLHEVRDYLRTCFAGAEEYADAFYRTMQSQHWQDRNRRPITHWRGMARKYASKAFVRNKR